MPNDSLTITGEDHPGVLLIQPDGTEIRAYLADGTVRIACSTGNLLVSPRANNCIEIVAGPKLRRLQTP